MIISLYHRHNGATNSTNATKREELGYMEAERTRHRKVGRLLASHPVYTDHFSTESLGIHTLGSWIVHTGRTGLPSVSVSGLRYWVSNVTDSRQALLENAPTSQHLSTSCELLPNLSPSCAKSRKAHRPCTSQKIICRIPKSRPFRLTAPTDTETTSNSLMAGPKSPAFGGQHKCRRTPSL